LKAGGGPADALRQGGSEKFLFEMPPPSDPLVARALQIAKLPIQEVNADRRRVLAHWEGVAAYTEAERADWLADLPEHCRLLYSASGFHGPLFRAMFMFLRRLGYPDVHLWRDVCKGFPSGKLLSRTGLWPEHPQAPRPQRERVDRAVAFKAAPGLLRDWLRARKPDRYAKELLARNLRECSKQRRVEVALDELVDGHFVAHPEFMGVSTFLYSYTHCSGFR